MPGIVEKAEYLKTLGITTIELMPAYEYDEMGRFTQFMDKETLSRYIYMKHSTYVKNIYDREVKVNYWGYTNGFYFAPKAAYSYKAERNAGEYVDYTTEFKDMVKSLHSMGIEVVMEFFFKDVTTAYILECVKIAGLRNTI